MLDAKHLAVFREVATQGSFSGAAAVLSYTPSAVSQQMAALERETGAALFDRTPRGMRLTFAGETLLQHAEPILHRLAELEARMTAIAGGHEGRIRLGSFPTATTAFVSSALQRFAHAHPEIELHLADGEPYESVARLRNAELDIALLFELDHWLADVDYDGRRLPDGREVERLRLFDDPFMLLLPKTHSLAVWEELELEQIADERIIGSPSLCAPWGTDLLFACRAAGFEPRFEPRYRVPDFQAVQAIVATGRGLSLIPRLALSSLRSDLVVRPLRGAPVRHVCLAFLADDVPSEALERIEPVVRAAAADCPLVDDAPPAT